VDTDLGREKIEKTRDAGSKLRILTAAKIQPNRLAEPAVPWPLGNKNLTTDEVWGVVLLFY
jgi:hypothetical protein